jgi:hypothetical protein
MTKNPTTIELLKEAARRQAHAAYVEDLREGRKQRSIKIPAKRGAGSYRRQDGKRVEA